MSDNCDRECMVNEVGIARIRETLVGYHKDYAGFSNDNIPDHVVQFYVAEAESNARRS